jgi:hypothetical protein
MLEAKREKVRWRAWAGVTPSEIWGSSIFHRVFISKMPVFLNKLVCDVVDLDPDLLGSALVFVGWIQSPYY